MDMIEPMFIPFCVEEQNMLGTEDGMNKFLQIISDEEDKEEVKTIFGQCSSSKDRWNAFVKFIKSKKEAVCNYYCYSVSECIYLSLIKYMPDLREKRNGTIVI